MQELAFTVAQGMAYVKSAMRRGLEMDAFASRLSHFFGVHHDFFEEIAKFRAARRIWARLMRDRSSSSIISILGNNGLARDCSPTPH